VQKTILTLVFQNNHPDPQNVAPTTPLLEHFQKFEFDVKDSEKIGIRNQIQCQTQNYTLLKNLQKFEVDVKNLEKFVICSRILWEETMVASVFQNIPVDP